MTDLITSDLVRLDARARLRQARGDPRAGPGRGRRGTRRRTSTSSSTDALAREETSSTGLPGGIAIPHCRTTGVAEPTLGFARLSPPVDFGAKDGPADIAFLIAAPAGGDATHLQLLTKLARSLVKAEFTDALRAAETPDEVVALVTEALGDAPPAAAPRRCRVRGDPRPGRGGEPRGGRRAAAPAEARSLVAVTACPTGIAHTYMAAEALERAAAAAGVELAVETQGSAGSTPLAHDTIARASAVIFAVDVGVRDRSRFAGKPMVSSSVKRPIDDADAMIAEALRYADDPNAPRVEGTADGGGGASTGGRGDVGRPHPPGADDRRLLHDPVRGRGRSAHRAQLPARRLRDRRPVRRHRRQLRDLRPARPRGSRSRPRAVQLRA